MGTYPLELRTIAGIVAQSVAAMVVMAAVPHDQARAAAQIKSDFGALRKSPKATRVNHPASTSHRLHDRLGFHRKMAFRTLRP
jgi:hypothetical protein